MQLVKKIGRYQQLPILFVSTVEERRGIEAFLTSLRLFTWSVLTLRAFRGPARWPSPGYVATLTSGKQLHFTEEEKQSYDQEMLKHHQVMQVYGLCKALGHPGMK